MNSTINILGYLISNSGLKRDADLAMQIINSDAQSHYMACANPHSLVEAKSDRKFAEALHQADILTPDGAGILLAARLLHLPMSERVAGSEFFLEVLKRCNAQGNVRMFFLGSTQDVLDKLVKRVANEFQNIEICGTYSPPFKPEFSDIDNSLMVSVINSSKANILWVGMTAPKQEKWILANKNRLDVNFIGAIGAVFDFYAGTKKRAPLWMCRLGLEWLPRLLREPRRLWKRNFVSTPLFLWAVIRQMLS
ncbi:WecB/TagA/CpsF family glycosyltransferase [Methylomonas sp. MgM2]